MQEEEEKEVQRFLFTLTPKQRQRRKLMDGIVLPKLPGRRHFIHLGLGVHRVREKIKFFQDINRPFSHTVKGNKKANRFSKRKRQMEHKIQISVSSNPTKGIVTCKNGLDEGVSMKKLFGTTRRSPSSSPAIRPGPFSKEYEERK